MCSRLEHPNDVTLRLQHPPVTPVTVLPTKDTLDIGVIPTLNENERRNVTSEDNSPFPWNIFYERFSDINTSISEKFLLFYSLDFDELYKNRQNKTDYSRTLWNNVRSIMKYLCEKLGEPPVAQGELSKHVCTHVQNRCTV